MHGARAVWKDTTSRLEAALRQVRHKARGRKPDGCDTGRAPIHLALDTGHAGYGTDWSCRTTALTAPTC